MSLLGSIYGLGVGARNALYDRGTLSANQLQGPVVSIGNISVGGSGKTPFTTLVGELLKARGIQFDVLSRGYGRDMRGVLLVDPNGSPNKYGDEPLLIARKLDVPVIVGESRFEAGKFAEQRFGPCLHILDDGFQHRTLARDFDIVLLSNKDLEDDFLPTGRLRDSIPSLKRADVIVAVDNLNLELLPKDKPIWKIKRGVAIGDLPKRPIAFCGIARPEIFLSQLKAAGVEIASAMTFRDHQRYTTQDIQKLVKLRDQQKANGFITTEKDAINLGEHLQALGPVTLAKVAMELEDAANAMDTMLRIISSRSASHEKILLSS